MSQCMRLPIRWDRERRERRHQASETVQVILWRALRLGVAAKMSIRILMTSPARRRNMWSLGELRLAPED